MLTPEKQYIAVIDTETNWYDQVMSIGVVLAEADTLRLAAAKYYVLEPEAAVGGMYTGAMGIQNPEKINHCTREAAMGDLCRWLRASGVEQMFAYNAVFDRTHLPELAWLAWYDILRVAAYRQTNWAIPAGAECCRTGRLKRNYGVEAILRLLSGDGAYCETHNALYDARDELKIMQLLGLGLDRYRCALLPAPKE